MDKKNIDLLDEIILSDEVVTNFYSTYESNIEFKNWIDTNIPHIKRCQEQQQNNPWHKYNVLGHILHSVEAMNQQTKNMDYKTKRLLAYTMLFHDIGKPDTHITREKNGVIIDSFFNHNKASVKIAKDILPMLSFDELETAIILKLIYKHDIFMFITLNKTANPYHRQLNDKLVEDEIKDLNTVGDGKYLLNLLLLVGKSDNLAQNEQLAQNSLKLLEQFDYLLNKKR